MLPALPFTHVIITFNKTRHFITAAENAALSILGNGVLAHLNGNSINTSSIAEVLTIEKFYEAYPDERPVEAKEFVAPDIETVPLDRQAERSEHSARGMLAGIAHYIENHGTNPVIETEYTKRKGKYRTLYGREFEYGERDRERVIDSLSESFGGQPKVPCRSCLKDYRHSVPPPKRTEDESLGTVEQFIT